VNEIVLKLKIRRYEYKKYYDGERTVVPQLDKKISRGFFELYFYSKLSLLPEIQPLPFERSESIQIDLVGDF